MLWDRDNVSAKTVEYWLIRIFQYLTTKFEEGIKFCIGATIKGWNAVIPREFYVVQKKKKQNKDLNMELVQLNKNGDYSHMIRERTYKKVLINKKSSENDLWVMRRNCSTCLTIIIEPLLLKISSWRIRGPFISCQTSFKLVILLPMSDVLR